MRWDSSGYDRSLPDPVCQGSLLNLRQPRNSNWIAFCNPADTARRDRLTLRMSPDAGRSWPVRIPVDQDPDPNSKRDYTAYSDLVELDRRKIGVLYEKDDYRQIVFRAVRWQ
jgi:sialidase-1